MYGQRIHKVYADGNTIQTIVDDSSLYIAGMDIHNGRLYLSERNTAGVYRILSVKTDGTDMKVIAGTGIPGYSGDGGPATQATLRQPRGIEVTNDGTIFFADSGNRAIRRIDGATGTITTVKPDVGRVEDLLKTSQGDLVYTTHDTCSVYQLVGPY